MISKQARNRQQLRLLVIIVVTKYSTLTGQSAEVCVNEILL